MNRRRVLALMGKECRELARDPLTIGLAILMPLVMLFLFGYAVTLDVNNIRLGVLDEDRSPAAEEALAPSAAVVVPPADPGADSGISESADEGGGWPVSGPGASASGLP